MDLFIVNNYMEGKNFMITIKKYDFEMLILFLIRIY